MRNNAKRNTKSKTTPTSEAFKLRLYDPHEGQVELHRSTARFRVVCCGRRWGKTYAAANEIVKEAWEHPSPIRPCWWVAPTYGQAMKAFDTISNRFASAIKSRKMAPADMTIVLKSGGIIKFKSAERHENLRGEGVRFLVVDEAAYVSRKAWEDVLRPMLADTGGRALLISTPCGKNWFYSMWKRGDDPNQNEYANFWFPTASSPYIPMAEIEEARNMLPADSFAQEWEAAFLDEAAGVFHGIEGCIFGELEEPDPTGHRYVIGWDIAKHTDFSVVTVIDTDHWQENQVTPHVAGFDRFNQISYAIQLARVEETARKYQAYVLMDSTGLGDPLYDALTARGIPCFPYHMSSIRKAQLIQNLAVTIQTKSITYPEIEPLLNELSAYRYEIIGTSIRYSAPEGDHDDCVMSLALAVWAAQHPAWQSEPKFVYEPEETISPI